VKDNPTYNPTMPVTITPAGRHEAAATAGIAQELTDLRSEIGALSTLLGNVLGEEKT
jgi:hypothetical protein